MNTEQQKAAPTKYKILLLHATASTHGDEEGLAVVVSPLWVEQDTVEARSQEQAIRQHAEKAGAGTYAAIPLRSWDPTEVKVQTTTKLTLK